jgi:hypothetical protein
MRAFRIGLLLVTGVSPAIADVGLRIIGTVSDEGGRPIPAATVLLEPVSETVPTDWAGRFAFYNIKRGSYRLTVSHVGYSSAHVEDVEVRGGEIQRLVVTLKLDPIRTTEQTVRSSALRRPELTRSQSVLTRSEWEESGAESLADILRFTPSVTVIEGDHSSRISIRGSPSRQVSVDLDGIPLSDAGTGETDFSMVKIGELEAVGVEVSGGGGKVHLVSRGAGFSSYTKLSGFKIESEYGVNGQREVSGSVGFGSRSVSGRLHANQEFDRGDFRYTLDDGTSHVRYNNDMFANSVSSRADLILKGSSVSTGMFYQTSQRGIPGLVHTVPTPEARFNAKRISGRLGGDIPVKLGMLRLNTYAQRYETDFENPAEQTEPESGLTIRFTPEKSHQIGERFGLRGDLNWTVNNLQPCLMLEGEIDRFIGRDLINNRITVGGVGTGNAERTSLRAEAGVLYRKQWNSVTWIASPLLTFNRVEDASGQTFTPANSSLNISLERKFEWGAAIWSAHYSRSVTIPSFNALFIQESVYAVGNRKLRPEHGETIEGSWELRRNTIDLDYSLKTTVFHREIGDLIVWRMNSFQKFYPDNLNSTKAQGMEESVGFSGWNGRVSVQGSYIYNRSILTTVGSVNRGNITPLSPLHSGSITTVIRTGNWKFKSSGVWVSRRFSSESNFDPISTGDTALLPYSRYDCSLQYTGSYKGTTFSLDCGVDNLLDENFRLVERSPLPGRTYFIQANIEYNS